MNIAQRLMSKMWKGSFSHQQLLRVMCVCIIVAPARLLASPSRECQERILFGITSTRWILLTSFPCCNRMVQSFMKVQLKGVTSQTKERTNGGSSSLHGVAWM